MSKPLVIVESPAKAKTIHKYLGGKYTVKASVGHIKDLPKNKLGVDVEKDFEPTYRIIPGKEKVVRELKSAAEKTNEIYLAADPDREGEAICAHLAEELGKRSKKVFRVLFNEITAAAVRKAFEHPGKIDEHKVEAQIARRVLDRLVGYQISPLLWDKVRRGLSAGRVQTVALRLIVEREKEIRAFVSEEYWTLAARLLGENPPPFEARAIKLDGQKFRITSEAESKQLVADLQGVPFVVQQVVRKEKQRRPVPPFITSKLQQEGYRKLHFTVKRTMTIAQHLYEGVEVGDEGSLGLITYMRTDSTRISQEALAHVREYIQASYGQPYLPPKAIHYAARKGAQEAHEAIRPTDVERTPDSLKPYLKADEWKLYALIWKRFVASQMNPAIFDATEIGIEAGRCTFKATGSILKFDGFLALYQESRDESLAAEEDEEEKEGQLPEVRGGEILSVEALLPEQHFTQPPPRFTEAMLVKELEERGIGRPSTYATIVNIIQNREYVTQKDGRFIPTETGEVVADLLTGSFPDIFDYKYTARMEDHLDEIEEGKEYWVDAMKNFYARFSKKLKQAQKEMKNVKREEVPTEESCEKCGSPMVIKWGRYGRFLACSAYPECKNTREITRDTNGDVQVEEARFTEETCEKCGRPMVIKKGRFGEFLACSGYPECKNTKHIHKAKNGEVKAVRDIPLDESCPVCSKNLVIKHGRFGEFTACSDYPECKYIKPKTTGVACPQKGCGGEIVERKSRRGKAFYGCSNYPDCNFVLWYKPVPEKCPSCGAPYLIERTNKKEGLIRYCGQENCKFKASLQPVGTT